LLVLSARFFGSRFAEGELVGAQARQAIISLHNLVADLKDWVFQDIASSALPGFNAIASLFHSSIAVRWICIFFERFDADSHPFIG
jgi:hypothetical protein